jgi:hypothetical protein
MNRRTPTIVALATVVISMIAAACGSESTSLATDGAGKDLSRGRGAAGYGIVGADRPPSVPLAAPAPPGPAQARAGTWATSSAANEAVAKETNAAATEQSSAVALPSQGQQVGAMLIRSGHAVIEVDSVQLGIARVRRLAQETGALVASTTLQTGNEQQRIASLELRVPSDRFDAVVNGLAPIGKVQSVNVSAQDVGEEFVDLTARLVNARRLEARLIELLANRTGRLSDVLTVERELARVREMIERYEGRLRYLQSHVTVSSLTVQVQEAAPIVASRPGENVIAEAFVEAWRRFVLITAGLIASLGVVVPVAVLGLGAYLIRRRYFPQRPAIAEPA